MRFFRFIFFCVLVFAQCTYTKICPIDNTYDELVLNRIKEDSTQYVFTYRIPKDFVLDINLTKELIKNQQADPDINVRFSDKRSYTSENNNIKIDIANLTDSNIKRMGIIEKEYISLNHLNINGLNILKYHVVSDSLTTPKRSMWYSKGLIEYNNSNFSYPIMVFCSSNTSNRGVCRQIVQFIIESVKFDHLKYIPKNTSKIVSFCKDELDSINVDGIPIYRRTICKGGSLICEDYYLVSNFVNNTYKRAFYPKPLSYKLESIKKNVNLSYPYFIYTCQVDKNSSINGSMTDLELYERYRITDQSTRKSLRHVREIVYSSQIIGSLD